MDGDPIATFISQEVFEHVNPGFSVAYLTGIADALLYLQQTFPAGIINPHEGIQLLLLGQTLNSLEFLKQLQACKLTNCEKLYIVVLTRSFRLQEIESICKYKINGYYSELLSASLIAMIIMEFNSAQSSWGENF